MAIPFSASPYIANSLNAVVPISATPTKLCSPPVDGFKYINIQYTFQETFTWLNDMRLGAPNPPLSQTCAMYVDASLCLHDVFVYFPDSGFTQVVGTGNTAFFPVITGQTYPKFFIGLVPFNIQDPYPADLTFDNEDLVNVFVFNQFLPGFTNNILNSTIIAGIGDEYGPSYKYVPDQLFQASKSISGGSGSTNVTLINNTQWFFSDLDISICGNTTDGSTTEFTIELVDDGTIIMAKDFVLNGTLQTIQLFDKSDLNYRSSGGGPLIANITVGSGIMQAKLSSNINGGILVP